MRYLLHLLHPYIHNRIQFQSQFLGSLRLILELFSLVIVYGSIGGAVGGNSHFNSIMLLTSFIHFPINFHFITDC
ncbi:hypothetical protein V6Z11_A04G174700 [Gossypium hirsutum]|uniref:Uncharacterized protein n=1 Tax=Gossypium darwinii TaxID=34276 RepID=A0A5D2GYT6_GOSDA|nr:hypothetical protein ES288_A04G176700v1 [Gossypium darwinii]